MIVKQALLPSRVVYKGSKRVPEGTLLGYKNGQWVLADNKLGIPAERILMSVGDPDLEVPVCIGVVLVCEDFEAMPDGKVVVCGEEGKMEYLDAPDDRKVLGRVDMPGQATIMTWY